MSYGLPEYGAMLGEPVRREAYAAALRAAVAPGAVVLEIGTGPGVFAMLAARLGARRVYALEPDDVIQVARELAARNGLDDRITFIQERSTRVQLEQPADVMVFDLRGILPLFGHNLPSVIDARRRLLRPGGVMIPARDRLWAALVDDREDYLQRTEVWSSGLFDLDLRTPLELVTNHPTRIDVGADRLVTEPLQWASVDYRTVEDSDVEGRLEWTAARPATAHGVAVWFDTELHGDIGFSSAPGEPPLIYRQLMLLFPEPLALAAGDRVAVALQASLVGDDYVWRWNTERRPAGGGAPTRFRQSTFFGLPLSHSRLSRRRSDHVPQLDDDGRVAAFILARIDGQRSLEAIARELSAAFPERFEDWRAALTRVGTVVETYSR